VANAREEWVEARDKLLAQAEHQESLTANQIAAANPTLSPREIERFLKECLRNAEKIRRHASLMEKKLKLPPRIQPPLGGPEKDRPE